MLDERFSVYAVIWEGLLIEAEEPVTHFIVMYNGKFYMTVDKSMTYREGKISAVAFLKVKGVT